MDAVAEEKRRRALIENQNIPAVDDEALLSSLVRPMPELSAEKFEQILRVIRESKPILRGPCLHFELRSGGHSSTFLHFPRIAQRRQHLQVLTELMAQQFAGCAATQVACRANIGMALAFSIMSRLNLEDLAIIEVPRAGQDFERRVRAGFRIRSGTKVLVIDDLTTTSRGLADVVAVASDKGADIVGVGVFASRVPEKLGGVQMLREKFPNFRALVGLDCDYYDVPADEECPLCEKGCRLIVSSDLF